MNVLVLCKFTPLGFETSLYTFLAAFVKRVNLPRWGLKQTAQKDKKKDTLCVNLPRWGLKHTIFYLFFFVVASVNLPRWGLKR